MNDAVPSTPPIVSNAVDMLRRHVRETPDRPALDFVDGLGRPGEALSYAGLDSRARAIAGHLVARCQPGARAIIAEPPGVNFVAAFFGCLYAGIIAVPVTPPRNPDSDEAQRFLHAADDAGCAAVLAPADVAERLSAFPALAARIATGWIDVEAPGPVLAEPRAATADDIAFLQYTSGSTGAPKGVVVRHGNIVHNANRITARCRLDSESRALIWLPHFHDLGLVGGILVPIYAGFPTTLMSPMSFAKRPLGWIRLVGQGGYTISGGPNFAFRLCVERLEPRKLDGVDLSSWRCAFNCAEPVEADTVRAFVAAFAPWGFRADAIYPCYGMAEATLSIASNPGPRPIIVFDADADRLEAEGRAERAVGGVRARCLVAVGQAAPGQTIAIVDPVSLAELDDRQVGEIWTADASVAAGYWQRSEESQAVFDARLPERPGLAFLRTGDLGFIDGGDLFITGRLKDLIIIDGRNLHPEDIEMTVRAAAGLSSTLAVATFAVERPARGDAMVIVLEVERRPLIEPALLQGSVQAALVARHDVSASEIVIVPAGRIPRTSSGKVRRKEARMLYGSGAFHAMARASVAESGTVMR